MYPLANVTHCKLVKSQALTAFEKHSYLEASSCRGCQRRGHQLVILALEVRYQLYVSSDHLSAAVSLYGRQGLNQLMQGTRYIV